MSLTAEIILGVVFLAIILGMGLGIPAFFFLAWPRIQRALMHKRFPIAVPGTPGMRMNKPPISTITVDDVAKAWPIFLKACLDKGYDKKKLKAEFSVDYIEFILGTVVDGPTGSERKRYIVDQYGRKIAGDRGGDVCRVVVIDGDTLAKVALFHEWGHGAHETKGKVDYEHRDDIMWKEIVPACKKEFAA